MQLLSDELVFLIISSGSHYPAWILKMSIKHDENGSKDRQLIYLLGVFVFPSRIRYFFLSILKFIDLLQILPIFSFSLSYIQILSPPFLQVSIDIALVLTCSLVRYLVWSLPYNLANTYRRYLHISQNFHVRI